MARFSLGRDDDDSGEGSSSPNGKRQRRDEQHKEDDDEEEEEEEGKRRRVIHGKGSESDEEDGISMTLTDPDVLDCIICMEPLIPPVFQCDNGHIACSTCCTKIGNKCPSCSWPIGYSRCLAIEKVVESIKISCQNAQYGCKERFGYAQKVNHEETCIYAPCLCPLSDCTFVGSCEQLSRHFTCKHWASARRFHYNCPNPVFLDKSEHFLVFQGEEDGLLFLLNNRIESIGNAISVTCIGTSSSKGGFFYDLISRRGSTSLKLQSYTKFTKGQTEGSPMDFLLIPNNFNGSYSQLKLDICIWSSREFE
ncbi:E3 ubiquitin-protein ligase SINA-like 10 [Macadamia integrifolia]|uniref:E3 ubiquitin-protein ligase SINA-like 10 n=1 Tax=Macadamia integrifolia TaxID=60698 RepID=UPI001C4FDA89|nr:E3 ubiquitin-protein ligase SINA-like 10 [Macadamia integrifolia]